MGVVEEVGVPRWVLWLGCLVAFVAVAWFAGAQEPPSRPAPAPGTVRLGPDPGEDVAAYLARLPAELPSPGVRAFALVQLAAEADGAAALALVDGTAPVSAVFHVPLERVQTALRFAPLEPGVPPGTALATAQSRAVPAAEADAGRLPGRPGEVAAVEAAALRDPGCRCVVALLVEGDGAALAAVAGRAGVRAVHAAPAGVAAAELALAPLLPGQVGRAGPLPDDGPVPAAPPD